MSAGRDLRDELLSMATDAAVDLTYRGKHLPPGHARAVARYVLDAVEHRIRAEAWDEAVREACDLGWLHDVARDDALARNPYRAASTGEGGHG